MSGPPPTNPILNYPAGPVPLAAPDLPGVPDAPRPKSPRAARRAWAEPTVRFWWILTAILLAAAVYFGIAQIITWSRETWLVTSGTTIDATVAKAGDITLAGRRLPPTSSVVLTFTFNGQNYEVAGTLADRAEYIVTGSTVPIRIDPNNPIHWTARPQPPVLGRELVGAAILAGLALLAGTLAFWRRRTILRLWTHGQLRSAIVVDSRHTALAPMSRAVRVTLSEGRDKRIFTVYVPTKVAELDRGDSLWLLCPPSKLEPAVPLAAYAGEPQQSNSTG